MSLTAADLKVKFSSDGADKVTRDVQGMDRSIRSFVGGIVQFAGGQILGNVVQRAARELGNLTGGALDFGKNMANVSSIATDAAFSVQGVGDELLRLTSDPRIAQGPATLAAGLYDVYSSGFQGAEGMAVLEQSALAATAGLTTTDVAARAITASLNAYGLGADQAQRVSDVLFQTVNSGVVTFEQLANNLGNVLPIASSLGITIEEVGAAYANMTLQGVSATQAETQIAAVMRSALNPTQALTDAVQAQGYVSAAAAIEQEGMAGFLKIVTDAAGGSGEALFDLLGTQEAMNAATILGGENLEEYIKRVEEMEGASEGAGATQKALEKQMESSSFAIQKAKVAAQTFATLGIGLISPVITLAANGMSLFVGRVLTPFVDVIGKAFKGGFEFNEIVKDMPQPLRRATHAVGVVAEALGDMWRDGFSPQEMRQALGGIRALGDEIGQGVRWVANIGIDLVENFGGFLWDHRGDIWGGIKGLLGWGAGVFEDAITATITGGINLAGDLFDAAGDLYGWVKGKLFGAPAGNASGADAWLAYGQQAKLDDITLADVAVKGGIKLLGMIGDAAGDLYGWVKAHLLGGGSTSFGGLIPGTGSPMPRQADWSIDLPEIALNVVELLVETTMNIWDEVSAQVVTWWDGVKDTPIPLDDVAISIGAGAVSLANDFISVVTGKTQEEIDRQTVDPVTVNMPVQVEAATGTDDETWYGSLVDQLLAIRDNVRDALTDPGSTVNQAFREAGGVVGQAIGYAFGGGLLTAISTGQIFTGGAGRGGGGGGGGLLGAGQAFAETYYGFLWDQVFAPVLVPSGQFFEGLVENIADAEAKILDALGLDGFGRAMERFADDIQDLGLGEMVQESIEVLLQSIPDGLKDFHVDWNVGNPFDGFGGWIDDQMAGLLGVISNTPGLAELANGDFFGAVRAILGGGAERPGSEGLPPSGEAPPGVIGPSGNIGGGGGGGGAGYGGGFEIGRKGFIDTGISAGLGKIDTSAIDHVITAIDNLNKQANTFAEQTFTAKFDADLTLYQLKSASATLNGNTFADQTFEATFDIDHGPAAIKYTDASLWGQTWEDALFTAAFDIDNGAAAAAYTDAFSWGNIWDAQVFTASFSVDTSGLYAAVDVARDVAQQISDLLPHSPARTGPLSEPISFAHIAQAARRDLAGLPAYLSGALRPADGAYAGAAGPGSIGGRERVVEVHHHPQTNVFALKSEELTRLMKQAEDGGTFANKFPRDLDLHTAGRR